jgi:hypothetical protein
LHFEGGSHPANAERRIFKKKSRVVKNCAFSRTGKMGEKVFLKKNFIFHGMKNPRDFKLSFVEN